MKLNWLEDPNNKLPSVSLTLLVATFIGALVAGGLEVAGLTKTTSVFTELFYSGCALYFGRRFQLNNKTFSSEKAEEVVNKLEKETQ